VAVAVDIKLELLVQVVPVAAVQEQIMVQQGDLEELTLAVVEVVVVTTT
jgi:hypothetical protein